MHRPCCLAVALSLLLIAAVDADLPGEWRAYGADKASTKYLPLEQITKDNVHQLRLAWRWRSPDQEILAANPGLWTMLYEATPLMVGGVIYTSTSLSQAAAIDALTGQTLWVHDPQTYQAGAPANVGFVHRGVAYWEDGEDHRILMGTGDGYLLCLDARTGKPIASFGENGRIDLTQGLRRPVDRALYAVPSPPVICRDVVVVGCTVLDHFAVEKFPPRNMPPGDVRGFDVRTGALRWTFHTIPQQGELGNETWENDSWKYTGNTNVWSMMSCDEELGYVYLPVSTPTNDFYGGERPGDGLFGESLVCLDVATGKRVWHFQFVHHGLWDYDPPAAPLLVDIEKEGKKIRAVAQVTKQALCYVFDRVSGKPLWPIEERPVPASQVPGERASPTQPFPTRPLPFDRQGVTPDDLIDFTSELRQAALDTLSRYDFGPLFTPPTERGTILLPGLIGGASWAGAAFDPQSSTLYVPSVTFPFTAALVRASTPHPDYAFHGKAAFGPQGPQGFPLFKPPYGRLTAIDLKTGDHLWMTPVGNGPRFHPALRHLDLPPLGWDRRIFPLATRTLLFAAQQGIWTVRGVSPKGNSIESDLQNQEAFLRAYDLKDGHLIAEIPLPGNATGGPITYVAGDKQFIAIPIGGASHPAELIALSLP